MTLPSNKVKMKVTEMRDADVEFISLVTRSANRIPFRIKKSDEETPMGLNLSSLARVLKGAKEPEPAINRIVGVATMAREGEELEAVKKSLTDNGFSVDNCEAFEDGSIVFKQDDFEGFDEEPSLVRLSDDMVLVVKGFSPYDMDVEGDFLTNVKAKGFYAGLDTATSAFRETLYQTLRNADDQAAAVTDVTALLTQFSTYVSGLVRAIPTKAFKAEQDLATLAVKEEAPAEAPAEVPAETPAEEGEKPADSDETPVEKPAEEEAPAEAAEETPAEPAVKAEAPADEVLTQLTQLTASVADLAKAVKSISEEQAVIKQNVDESARKAEDASKAVKGVVLGEPVGAESPASTRGTAKKADEDPRSGCFDTAFLRRN